MKRDELDPAQLVVVTNALRERAGEIKQTAPRQWQLPTLRGRAVSLVADGGWFHFEAPLPCRPGSTLPGPRRSVSLLSGNSVLPYGMSYCVGPHSRAAYLVADVPLHDHNADTEKMVRDVGHLFSAFRATVDTSPTTYITRRQQEVDGLHDPLTVDHDAGEAARSHCEKSGWEYHERGNGQLAITLDVPDQFCQAYAYEVGEGEFRLSTILQTPAKVSATSRHAMATLLLTASRVVRMARATVVTGGPAREYRWEVAWAKFPSASQFHCGLSALSIACCLTLHELQALSDAAVAGTYLSLRARGSQ